MKWARMRVWEWTLFTKLQHMKLRDVVVVKVNPCRLFFYSQPPWIPMVHQALKKAPSAKLY
ncbi:MAG: hypothetical protein EBZ69_04015 [Alphaproteobacteria bacterium]|nr:hypothetical protein [Alphaproteobacteria bacterium]NDG04193.1 hypothetical protein [Alphaproteobacteria bacterium]